MTEYKKVVFSCFLISAVLGFLVFSKLLTVAVTYFDFYAYGEYVDILVRVVPIVAALGLFIGLYQNAKANAYMTEVVVELKKVVWPGKKEVYAATLVVIVAVLIASAILGLFDSLWSFLIRHIIQYGR